MGEVFTIEKEDIELIKSAEIEFMDNIEDINMELEDIYRQIQSLKTRKEKLTDSKLVEKNYDALKKIP